jgi:membrane protease YdiL (CAAX protease family)
MPDLSPSNGSLVASADDRPGAVALAIGLAAAGAAFTATFQGPRDRFWSRMTATGLALGGYAMLTSAPARRGLVGLRPRHVPLGLASAAALYLTFKAGDVFARRFVPGGDEQIRDIYALRTLRPQGEIATRLATVIGPAEELFWRGLVQAALMRRLGRWKGGAVAAAAYGGVHVVTGNFTLFGAAGIAGAHWCALYSAGTPLGALIVSHVAWDVWIFLVQPTGETSVVKGEMKVVSGDMPTPVGRDRR